jgi:thiamine-phosphate pyrophosphorylase
VRIRGYYAILDRDDEALARVLAAHACVLQVRIKPCDSTAELVRIGRMARGVTRAAGIPLVIDDRFDVALAVEADGVHLGQTDVPLADARRALARRPMAIGVSTHDLEQVRRALAVGADYLGFGPIYPTATKANPDPVRGLDLLRAAVELAGTTPVVAIGGITPATAPHIAATGAAAAAVIAAINKCADPQKEAAHVRSAWPSSS